MPETAGVHWGCGVKIAQHSPTEQGSVHSGCRVSTRMRAVVTQLVAQPNHAHTGGRSLTVDLNGDQNGAGSVPEDRLMPGPALQGSSPDARSVFQNGHQCRGHAAFVPGQALIVAQIHVRLHGRRSSNFAEGTRLPRPKAGAPAVSVGP